jgi:hypothetical protein
MANLIAKNVKPTHITKTYVVTKKELNNFIPLENPRMLREMQVLKLLASLRRGKHFEAHLVVNEVNDKYRVIDGNHRLEAMRRFLENNTKDASVEIRLNVYRNLSDVEEKERFTDANSGLKQTPLDMVQVNKDDIPIIKDLENFKDVKITIYKTNSSINMIVLLKAYLGIWTNEEPISAKAGGERIIKLFKTLTTKDSRFIKRFLIRLSSITGDPGSSNIWMQSYFLPLLMRIVYDNPEHEEYFWELFQKRVMKSAVLRTQGTTSASWENQRLTAKLVLDMLNSNKKKAKFVIVDNRANREIFEQL